jgi:5-phospho-D-xylono-1,4-lactonase
MSFVRTVCGDVPSESLGVCYAHEHLIIDESFTTFTEPEFRIDDVESCVAELLECHAVGVRAMVDSMPMACGRNVVKLAEVSRRSGVSIVCPTGLHLKKYYPPGHWSGRIEVGIDVNDGCGPEWMPSGHRAGLIKIASGLDRIDAHEHRVFEAAAMAHRKTGAPILTHTEQGTAGLEQVELLRSLGVELGRVTLSHTDRKPDLGYHRELLSSGVNLEYDSAFRWNSAEVNPTLDLLVALVPEFPDQIMLGMDAARRGYWRKYGGAPGLAFLWTTWVERMLASGISRDLVHRVFVLTPTRAFSFGGGRDRGGER